MLTQQEFVTKALTIFDESQIKTDKEDLAVWGTDWTRSFTIDPLAAVLPTSTEQIVSLVKRAPEWGIQLVPSGGRSGLSGGAVASNQEVVVALDRMNQILDFDRHDKLVHCQAGLITQELQEFADKSGLFYPVNFASAGSSQIGGNIATNAGGIRVIRYGLTRRWVAGITVVTGTGEVLKLNQGLVKNATGYDLRHLFIGSEGTLGIITEAQMGLLPKPIDQHVLVLAVPDFRHMLGILETFQEDLELSAFEFFSDLAMQKVLAHRGLENPCDEQTPFYVLLEYDADRVDEANAAFVEVLDKQWVVEGIVGQTLDQAASLWELRDGISESIAPYTPYKNDISVRISEVPGFLDDVNKIVSENYPEFEVCWYGHIGDGNLHLNILRPDGQSIEEFYERCHHISPKLFELIQQRSGSISAEHGVGLLKRDFLQFSRSGTEIAYMRRMKEIFDPYGILNPGKLLPERDSI